MSNRTSEAGVRRPRDEAQALVERIEALELHGCTSVQVCGSWRRGSETLKDLDVVICRDGLDRAVDDAAWRLDPGSSTAKGFSAADLWDSVREPLHAVDVLRQGNQQMIMVSNGWQVDFWLASKPEELGGMLVFATGAGKFNIALRTMAKRKGLKLNRYGVWDDGGLLLTDHTEQSVFDVLGMKWVEPADRKGFGSAYGNRL